jgi:hypothetical protein
VAGAEEAVIAQIPEYRFYELPAALQEKLRVYSKQPIPIRAGVMTFEMADERYEEIVKDMTP